MDAAETNLTAQDAVGAL